MLKQVLHGATLTIHLIHDTSVSIYGICPCLLYSYELMQLVFEQGTLRYLFLKCQDPQV